MIQRAIVLDRHGQVLASSLPTFSVYIHPHDIQDKQEAAIILGRLFPQLRGSKFIRDALHSKKKFVWLVRHLPPYEKNRITAYGLHGMGIIEDSQRVYPYGSLFCHVLGTTNADQQGTSGLEKGLNDVLTSPGHAEPLSTSLDVRLQEILHRQLSQTVEMFQAQGANGVLIHVHTGEVLAMVSLPDFAPDKAINPTDPSYFDRNSHGVYEFGSIMKIANTAAFLDSGKGTLASVFDATHPLYIGRHRVTDFKGKHRPLNVLEAFIYSSNIAHAKMAVVLGARLQKQYFTQLGFSQPVVTELGRSARPLFPQGDWSLPRVMTAGYGYGFAVTPLHMAKAMMALSTGYDRPLTFLTGQKRGSQLVYRKGTVDKMTYLMEQAVLDGQAKNAAANNCRVGGKTGTANIQVQGRYRQNCNLTSTAVVFPAHHPQYALVISIDRPKGNAKTHGYVTGGWIAAPAIARIVEEMAPLLGVLEEVPSSKPKRP